MKHVDAATASGDLSRETLDLLTQEADQLENKRQKDERIARELNLPEFQQRPAAGIVRPDPSRMNDNLSNVAAQLSSRLLSMSNDPSLSEDEGMALRQVKVDLSKLLWVYDRQHMPSETFTNLLNQLNQITASGHLTPAAVTAWRAQANKAIDEAFAVSEVQPIGTNGL
ncbi:MAG: hypothetical protein P4M13_10730 [Alphaproteobacteria bacterium]|nr:hypothetical protein [Alphaproteobacteria bacterium]